MAEIGVQASLADSLRSIIEAALEKTNSPHVANLYVRFGERMIGSDLLDHSLKELGIGTGQQIELGLIYGPNGWLDQREKCVFGSLCGRRDLNLHWRGIGEAFFVVVAAQGTHHHQNRRFKYT